MQFKRMAVVAAAAVAGQTLLMAAPAVAEDQPAVTVPDAVPADAASGAGSPDRTETPRTPPAKAPAAGKTKAEGKAAPDPAPGPEDAGRPEDAGHREAAVRAVAAPAVPAVPGAKAPAQAPARAGAAQTAPGAGPVAAAEGSEAAGDGQDTGSGRLLMGPEVTVQGIPADGFEADGSWTPLTVTVDNSGHVAVPGYTPVLGVSQAAGRFEAAHIEVEYRTAGGPWTAAALVQGEETPALGYALGAAAAVPSGRVRTIDVRISFAAHTPVVPFDLTADGTSRVGNSTGTSPTSSYATRIAGAPGGDEDPVFTEGPALAVSGVPESVRAGGDWTDLTVRLDNSGKGDLAAFDLGLVLARPDFVSMRASQITVEVLRPGADGRPAAWQSVEITSDEDGHFFAGGLAGGPVAAGEAFDVPVRVRFSADAPTGAVSFFAWGTSQVDAETPPPWAGSRSPRHLTTLLEPAPAPGGGTPGGGTPGGGIPGGGIPGGGIPGGGTPGGGTPGGGTPGGGTPGSETPGGETPGGGTPGGETPGAGIPGVGIPGGSTPGAAGGDGPKPNGGTGTPAPGTGTGGELAATGADPATSWALGGAGTALVLGAALVAGTGRHRRRSSTG
ncbi:hypothetical protein ACFWUZ_23480 [Streptomyces sp. NPDC058646]|uniref:hypothetical protein n=1 Tax=Streptomyces sp. NPDC058646 TaxID=3346574 RepID=UPI0036542F4D